MKNIYPSLMAADQLNLEKTVELLQPYCAGFHVDVMDNSFVPNITFGKSTINALAKISKKVWIHLMIDEPMGFYAQLELPVDSIVSFHIESNVDILEFIKTIKEKKQRASIAISPKTPISRIVPFLHVVDQVLVMSVDPGFSGQSLQMSSVDRVIELVELRNKHKSNCRIGIDGGINLQNIDMFSKNGVDDYAVGGGVFNQEDPVAALRALSEKNG